MAHVYVSEMSARVFRSDFLNVTMLHVTCNFAEVPTITVDFRLTILVAIDPGHKKKKKAGPRRARPILSF